MTPRKEVPMAKEKFLAVAFTDVNGNDNYNPGKDVLIAALQDTDLSGSVTLGDTVILGDYPRLDGSIAGTLLGPDTTITRVDVATSTEVGVGVANGNIDWFAGPGAELFFTQPAPNTTELFLQDAILAASSDIVVANSSVLGPALPNTDVNESTVRFGDQPFLDVFIA
jgi:hypothetical protein